MPIVTSEPVPESAPESVPESAVESVRGAAAAPVYAYRLHGNVYLNVTNRCTLRCRFCPKFNGEWTVRDYGLRLHHEPDVDTLLDAVGKPGLYREAVFCGLGEPTLRLDVVLETARRLRAQGVRVRLNTDGLANRVHARDVTGELAEVIDAVSVSLNAQNAQVYARHCRPRFDDAYPAVLDFLRRAAGCIPEVTATAIAGLDGVDIAACADIAAGLGVGFRRRELDRVG